MDESIGVNHSNVKESQKTNSWAIASFTIAVLGLIHWIFAFAFGMLDPSSRLFLFSADPPSLWILIFRFLSIIVAPPMTVATIVFGIAALSEIRHKGNREKGNLLAISGILLALLQIFPLGIVGLGILIEAY